MQLFGYEITRKKENNEDIKSFVEPQNDDGAVNVAAAGGAVSSFLDLEGTAKTEAELIQRYRSMLLQPEVQQAVDDIINEAITITHNDKPVLCNTDDLQLPDNIKKKIREEFDGILGLLDFSNQGYEIFQKWYVDGRINYHVMIDESSPKKGIQELRYIDPRKIRKVREYERQSIGTTGGNAGYVKRVKNEYYVYSDRGFNTKSTANSQTMAAFNNDTTGLRIAKDSIVDCTSGLMNENNTLILSHLHKAFKPLNQLRMMEDSSVIYRISRAPERRIFYIDVGNLPKMKAEQYLSSMMQKHKNKLVYDATTGDIADDRRHMAMTDDFWLPRREGGRGTEITTLPGGQNLGEMEDIEYFQKRLYKSLNVPITRMESEGVFNMGRGNEITRDEIKFSKFIRRLQARFSIIFDKLLEKQLVLKGVISPEEWEKIKQNIRYDFMSDSYFQELKDSEVLTGRLQILNDVEQYVGEYYSKAWIRKNILFMSEDEIETIKKEIEEEEKGGEYEDEEFGDETPPKVDTPFSLNKDTNQDNSGSNPNVSKDANQTS